MGHAADILDTLSDITPTVIQHCEINTEDYLPWFAVVLAKGLYRKTNLTPANLNRNVKINVKLKYYLHEQN